MGKSLTARIEITRSARKVIPRDLTDEVVRDRAQTIISQHDNKNYIYNNHWEVRCGGVSRVFLVRGEFVITCDTKLTKSTRGEQLPR